MNQNISMMNKIATDMVVQKVVEDKTNNYLKSQKQTPFVPEEADVFSDLSDDSTEKEIMNGYKAELEKRMGDIKQIKPKETGTYSEKSEKEFFELIKAKKDRLLCHFYHPDFEKCKVMHYHLSEIAHTHTETLFIKLDVTQAPFLVTKLKIKVLPALHYIRDGKTQDKIIGFEGFSEGEGFKRKDLLMRLSTGGAIDLHESEKFKFMKAEKKKINGDSDSDED